MSLTSALDGGEWSTSRNHFTPRERTTGAHWIGSCLVCTFKVDTEKLFLAQARIKHVSHLFQKDISRKLLMAGAESRLLLPFSQR